MERFSIYGGEGVFLDEGTGGAFADDGGGGIAAFTEDGRTPVGTVRVGRKEVDAIVAEQRVGRGLGLGAEFAGDGHGGDLDEDAALDVCFHDGRAGLDLSVALGVDEDGMDALEKELVEELVGADRDRELGKFHEHVVARVDFCDAVGAGLLRDLVGDVDLVAREDFYRRAVDGFVKGGHALEDLARLGIVREAIEHMGRGDHLGDAVFSGDARHLDRLFHAAGAVVDLGHDVGVNVDHLGRIAWGRIRSASRHPY